MKRKPLPKNVRFEVFKRDKFTCQYCGRKAPDVVLEVDHITPVCKGGTNDIMNLITSCFDCNRGKSKKTLDDNSTIAVQQKMLEKRAERKEQLDMMFKWKIELSNYEVDYIKDMWQAVTGTEINHNGVIKVCEWLSRFTVEELLNAIDISASQYLESGCEKAFSMIPRIAYCIKHQNGGQQLYYFNYTRKALRNKGWGEVEESDLRHFINTYIDDESKFNKLKEILYKSDDVLEFEVYVAETFDTIEPYTFIYEE